MQLRYCLAWVLRPLCSELGAAPAYQREFSPQLRASLFTSLLAATDPGSPEKGIVGEHAWGGGDETTSMACFMCLFPVPVSLSKSCPFWGGGEELERQLVR